MVKKEKILPQDMVEKILHLHTVEKVSRKQLARMFKLTYRKVADLIRFSKLDNIFTTAEEQKMRDYLIKNSHRDVTVAELRIFFPNKPEYTIRNKKLSIMKQLICPKKFTFKNQSGKYNKTPNFCTVPTDVDTELNYAAYPLENDAFLDQKIFSEVEEPNKILESGSDFLPEETYDENKESSLISLIINDIDNYIIPGIETMRNRSNLSFFDEF